jgi:signal transduction histidine kinase
MNLSAPFHALDDYFVPLPLLDNPEVARRARLIVRFAFVGGVFGFCYASFYLLIGHVWGAAIIVVCGIAMVSVPWLLRRTGRLALAGNLHALILTIGFCGLTSVEGGVHGHAIAWLASVPLCVLLLVDSRAAVVWCGISFLATLSFCALEAWNITVPIRYPASWSSAVTGAGFLGLTIFLSALGVTFETGRKRAFRRMQDALQDLSGANQRLTQMNNEKNEMLGIAAHDLKNPLTAIIGFAQLIATTDNAFPARTKADAAQIIDASTHMRSIVGNLLDINAIEEGRFPLDIQICDLVELAVVAIENQKLPAAAKDITLELSHPPEPAAIKGDFRAILQVLDNLISNAIKFSPIKRKVFVRLQKGKDEVSLEVQDQGPGLSEEDRGRLFEKFAVLSARPTAGESSTGLGLSIVKRLVEVMGGRVSCRSAPGEGATFVFEMRAATTVNRIARRNGDAAGAVDVHSSKFVPDPGRL